MPSRTLTRGSGIVSKDNIHLQRHLRVKIGLSPEEIAQQDGVSVETVKASIATIDAYRALHTLDFANEAVVGLVIDCVPEAKKTLIRGMHAKKRVPYGTKTVVVDDIQMQQKAVENFTGLVTALQPKGGKPVNVNVSANSSAQAAAVSHSETRTMGFEERLRAITKKVEAETARTSEVGTTFDEGVLEPEEDEGVIVPAGEEGRDDSPEQ